MSDPVRIIGIDPGLRNTGWGIVESDGVHLAYVASGAVSSDADLDLANRLVQIHEGLTLVIMTNKPQEAAVEQTFVNRDGQATLKLGQARGMALLAPAQNKIPVSEYAPNQVKKTVIGAGHGDKSQIRAMLSHLLPRAKTKTDDEADALAIAITHAHHRHVSTVMREAGTVMAGKNASGKALGAGRRGRITRMI